eukprot:4841639-Prymnesium_polylepis.1
MCRLLLFATCPRVRQRRVILLPLYIKTVNETVGVRRNPRRARFSRHDVDEPRESFEDKNTQFLESSPTSGRRSE